MAAAALLAGVVAVRGVDTAARPANAAVAQDTSADASAARPKNVLLITIDTLRADHMSCYGYSRPTTPNLDKLFAKGTRFECAFSTASCTVPSHTSILTGLHPSATSVGLDNGQKFALDPSVTTLAELCQAAGMYTAAVVSSHTLLHKVGLDQGFSIYDDRIAERNPQTPIGKQPADFSCDKVIKKYLKDTAGKPFFFWLHLMDPHGPYVPPPEWLAKFPIDDSASHVKPAPLILGGDGSGYGAVPKYQVLQSKPETDPERYIARYDAEIALADDCLGKLFDTLDERGMLKDTLLIVTSDHGEAMGEDNFFFAHSHSVGRDQVHVPLAFVGPGIRAGGVVSQPVSNMDIFATVCDFLGLKPPDNHARSLVPTLTTGTTPEPHAAFFGAYSQWGAALDEHHYRRDRRPASDRKFWAKNYNSDAIHKPCGEQLTRLRDGACLPLSAGATIRSAAAEFARDAEAGLKSVPKTVLVNRTKDERIQINKIGYFTGDDGPPRNPKRPPPKRASPDGASTRPVRTSPPAGEGTP